MKIKRRGTSKENQLTPGFLLYHLPTRGETEANRGEMNDVTVCYK